MLHVNQLIGFGSGGDTNIQFVGGAAGGVFGQGTGTEDLNLDGTLTGGIAAAPQVGDFVVAAFCVASTASRTLDIALTENGTQYTLIGSQLYSNDTYDTNLRAGYRFLQGGDFLVNFNGPDNVTDAYAYAALVFRGVDTVTPIDVTTVTATNTNSVLANPPSITPATAGAVIVAIGGGAHTQSSTVFYTSSDLLGFQSASGADDNDAIIGMGYKISLGSSFDPAAFTFSGTDDTNFSWAAITLALRSK